MDSVSALNYIYRENRCATLDTEKGKWLPQKKGHSLSTRANKFGWGFGRVFVSAAVTAADVIVKESRRE